MRHSSEPFFINSDSFVVGNQFIEFLTEEEGSDGSVVVGIFNTYEVLSIIVVVEEQALTGTLQHSGSINTPIDTSMYNTSDPFVDLPSPNPDSNFSNWVRSANPTRSFGINADGTIDFNTHTISDVMHDVSERVSDNSIDSAVYQGLNVGGASIGH